MPPSEYTDWRRVAVPETEPEAEASKVVKPYPASTPQCAVRLLKDRKLYSSYIAHNSPP